MIALRLLLVAVVSLPWIVTDADACEEAFSIPTSGADVAAFVPPHFEITNAFERDFNGDGLLDRLVLIGPRRAEDCRPLLVLFKKPDGSYELSARADAIMAGSGGVHSGPFGEIELRKNTFVVTQYTGSTRVQNSSQSQFQFRNGDWYLIGIRQTANMSEGEAEFAGLRAPADELILSYSIDRNLLNGDQEETWELFDTKTEKDRKVAVRKKVKPKPLTRLEEYTDASDY